MYLHVRTTRRWVGPGMPPLEYHTFEVVESRREPGKQTPRSRYLFSLGGFSALDLVLWVAGDADATERMTRFQIQGAQRLVDARRRGVIPDAATFDRLAEAADRKVQALVTGQPGKQQRGEHEP